MGGLSRFNSPMTRRDFLKSLGGMAASAALPGVPGAAPAVPAAPVPKFVTDPHLLSGFSEQIGASGSGKWATTWMDEWQEVEGMTGDELRNYIRGLNLHRANATLPQQSLTAGSDFKVGQYTWNKHTQQWHPTVAFQGENPWSFKYRYLEPGSPIPHDALEMDPDGAFGHLIEGPYDQEHFSNPMEMGKQLMDDWHRHKAWEFQEDGPDKKEMHDPEYRKRYIEHATKNRLAPGGRPETPRSLMDSGLPTGNVAIPGADDAGSLPTMIGRLRRAQKPAATGIMSLAPLLLAPQGEEQ